MDVGGLLLIAYAGLLGVGVGGGSVFVLERCRHRCVIRKLKQQKLANAPGLAARALRLTRDSTNSQQFNVRVGSEVPYVIQKMSRHCNVWDIKEGRTQNSIARIDISRLVESTISIGTKDDVDREYIVHSEHCDRHRYLRCVEPFGCSPVFVWWKDTHILEQELGCGTESKFVARAKRLSHDGLDYEIICAQQSAMDQTLLVAFTFISLQLQWLGKPPGKLRQKAAKQAHESSKQVRTWATNVQKCVKTRYNNPQWFRKRIMRTLFIVRSAANDICNEEHNANESHHAESNDSHNRDNCQPDAESERRPCPETHQETLPGV